MGGKGARCRDSISQKQQVFHHDPLSIRVTHIGVVFESSLRSGTVVNPHLFSSSCQMAVQYQTKPMQFAPHLGSFVAFSSSCHPSRMTLCTVCEMIYLPKRILTHYRERERKAPSKGVLLCHPLDHIHSESNPKYVGDSGSDKSTSVCVCVCVHR